MSLIRMDQINGPRLGEQELDTLMSEHEPSLPLSLPEGYKKPSFHDPIVYIYTSGTTGMPKAAIITNARLVLDDFAFLQRRVKYLKISVFISNTLMIFCILPGLCSWLVESTGWLG